MAVIAIYSVKGGVGKTTMAANLAWHSASVSCRKTLLWDLDPAAGAGFLVGTNHKPSHVAQGVFTRDLDPAEAIVTSPFPRLHVLPSDESLRNLDSLFVTLGKRQRLAKLTQKLAQSYERIILDCPPVLNEISSQIIRAADLVIVPLPPSPLSGRAFDMVMREIVSKAKRQPDILPVLSMIDRRRALHRQAMAEQPDWPVVPLSSAIEQCAVHRQPVAVFAPNSPSARHFGQLWETIERRLTRATVP